jgi:predicted GIY-YIG superfamily endonuclease
VPGQRYVGFTTDLKQRFDDHNAGNSAHTAKFKPWRLMTYIASDRADAEKL